MRRLAKKLLVGASDSYIGRSLLTRGSGRRVPVFMLHRFRNGTARPSGHDAGLLSDALAYLERRDFQFMSVDDIVAGLTERTLPDRVVGFTMDDGYEDQGSIGAEVFLAHHCPVTIYLVTGMIDGRFWPWEARVAYLLSAARQPFVFAHAGREYGAAPDDPGGLTRARRSLVKAMKSIPAKHVEAEVHRLAALLELEVPEQPPEEFRALTWSQVNALEARGITFGAHTVRHVTLSAEDDETARREIEESTRRVREKLHRPSSVFCYPTGRAHDYGQREVAQVRRLNYTAALSSVPGYCTLDGDPDTRFELMRFGFPDNLHDFKAIVLQLLRFAPRKGPAGER